MIAPPFVAVARIVLLLLEIGLTIPALYLLVVTVAALWTSHRLRTHSSVANLDTGRLPTLVVLIPAHNEEALIRRLLENVAQLQYPRDRLEVYVIADNCDDATASIAREHGWAHTLERADAQRKGKGYALEWALEQLAAAGASFDACVMFDADSVIDARCLLALAAAYQAGADAAQGQYTTLNAFETPTTSLRWLALILMNHVRQLGRSTLGASSSLAGNGMLFSRALLARRPWRAFGLTEDYQYYLDLVEHGERVHYAPDALVRADMPTTFKQMRTQDIRWESDTGASTLAVALRLLRAAVRYRRIAPLEAVIELLTPPLSLLVGGAVLLSLAALGLWWPPTLALALVIWVGVAVYLGSALWLERPPWAFYRDMLYAPLFVVWKLWVTVVAVRLPHRSREWVRTSRVAPHR